MIMHRQRWSPKTAALLERIGCIAAAQGLEAYAVGGFVRDGLLGADATTASAPDIDITSADGLRLARVAAREFHAPLTEHAQFGTATLIMEGAIRLDFATWRKETYRAPAAYPRVAPGSLKDDLLRRDFTINALAMALHPRSFGRVIDYCGGREDLRRRRIRVLHARSFTDDPSRLLRAIRFEQRFHCAIEPQTARWMRDAFRANGLARLNRGRLHKELTAMLREPRPWACIRRVIEWLSD